jgi:methylenetetrahydrofolate dehydrogenase (NADP+)/methenyltetrahydrofolate cyclohydrolase
MQLFDGNYHAKVLDDSIRKYVTEHPLAEKLCIVQVGENPASGMYINLKVNKCNELGIPVTVKYFATGTDESTLLQNVMHFSHDETVKSIIIQLPMPFGFSNKALDALSYEKDVDCLSMQAKVKLYNGTSMRFPPIIRSTQHFMSVNALNITGKKVVVVGSGELVGKPLMYYFKTKGAEVTEITSYKKGTKLDGELVVLGTGNPSLVIGTDIVPNANVIDFGSTIVAGRAVGDLDMNSDLSHLNFLSPSPGGMGPLVIRFLIMNHLGI